VLTAALTDTHGEAQRLAGWALGQIGDSTSTGPLLRAYFGRRDGDRAELAWAIARTAGGAPSPVLLASPSDYPIKGNPMANNTPPKLDLPAKIANLPGTVPAVTLTAAVIATHVDDIVAGGRDALAEHRDIVVGALSDLDARTDGVGLAGLVGAGPVDEKTRAALAKVGAGIAPAVADHLADADPKVRALAIGVLAKLDSKDVEAVITKGLGDKTDLVRHAAMRAVVIVAARRPAAGRALSPAVGKALLEASDWQDRTAAANALAELGGAELAALTKAAADRKAYVREAVAIALGASAVEAAVEPLIALSRDDVPDVRAAAARALGKVPGAAARKRRGELAGDPDAKVKAAARQ
jgi:HEAT repeat protein